MPPLRDFEFAYLKEHRDCLAPIAIAIDKCQDEKTGFYGLGIPIIRKVKTELEDLKNSGNLEYCTPIVDVALAGLEKRFGNFIEQDEEFVLEAMLATASHPMFKMGWIKAEKRPMVQEKLIWMAEKLSEFNPLTENDEEQDDYFKLTTDDIQRSTQAKKNKASIEVLQYLDDDSTSLQMLHRYPAVKEVFLKLNTALISSAPVERLFSYGSVILHGRRGRLTDQHFEKICLLKAMANTK